MANLANVELFNLSLLYLLRNIVKYFINKKKIKNSKSQDDGITKIF